MAGTMQDIVNEYKARSAKGQYQSPDSCTTAAPDCEAWMLEHGSPAMRVTGVLHTAAEDTLVAADAKQAQPQTQLLCSLSYTLIKNCIWVLEDEFPVEVSITGVPHEVVKLGFDGIILPDWSLGQFANMPSSTKFYMAKHPYGDSNCM